jgi:hypothetical protein
MPSHEGKLGNVDRNFCYDYHDGRFESSTGHSLCQTCYPGRKKLTTKASGTSCVVSSSLTTQQSFPCEVLVVTK